MGLEPDVNVHPNYDARERDPWSPSQGDRDLSHEERRRIEELEIHGELVAIDNVLTCAGVPRAGRDAKLLTREERVKILAAWATERLR